MVQLNTIVKMCLIGIVVLTITVSHGCPHTSTIRWKTLHDLGMEPFCAAGEGPFTLVLR